MARGRSVDPVHPQGAAQSRAVASTAVTGSAALASTCLAKKSRTAREVAREKKLAAKRREVEELEMQMQILSGRLEEVKREVGELESGGCVESDVPLLVQVEMRRERYRGFKRMWEDMSDEERFWYYVESEESKVVE